MNKNHVIRQGRNRQQDLCRFDPPTKLTTESRRLYFAAHFSFFLRELHHGRLIRASDLTALVPFAAADSNSPGPGAEAVA